MPRQLTDREKQVLSLVAEGRSNKEIADTLGISFQTAKNHVSRIMLKMDAQNRTVLAVSALKGLA